MKELTQGSAQTWECDAMGHLNVRFYSERAHEALRFLLLGLRVTPTDVYRESTGEPARLVSEHIRFHREVLPGTAFRFCGAWLRTQGEHVQRETALVAVLEMRHALSDDVLATFVLEVELVQPVPFGATSAAVDVLPPHAAPRGLRAKEARADLGVDAAERLGLFLVHRRVFSVADTDAAGFVRPATYMACISDGIPHLVARLRGEDRARTGQKRLGGAALEYRFVYRRRARAGELAEVRSGLVAVGRKTQHFAHWLLDPETGGAWASAEAIAVSFDLEKRRAACFDPETRSLLESRTVEGLSL